MARIINTTLYISFALFMVSCAIGLAFLSNMVYWLHYRAGQAFNISYHGSAFSLHGKPTNLVTDQGHTSNGAAGTGFVAIGLGGIFALWLRDRRGSHFLHHTWLVFNILSPLLTLSALIYTFVVTDLYNNQTIDIALASTLHNNPYPNYVAYPKDTWTPETWLTAVLQLPLQSSSDRSDIQLHLALMKGWRYNLIPMLVLGVAVSFFAFMEALQHRRPTRDSRGSYELTTSKRMST